MKVYEDYRGNTVTYWGFMKRHFYIYLIAICLIFSLVVGFNVDYTGEFKDIVLFLSFPVSMIFIVYVVSICHWNDYKKFLYKK